MLDTEFSDGSRIKLRQQTDYPWDGLIRITIDDAPTSELSVFLRIPGWINTANVTVNGTLMGGNLKTGQYFQIKRTWLAGSGQSVN